MSNYFDHLFFKLTDRVGNKVNFIISIYADIESDNISYFFKNFH